MSTVGSVLIDFNAGTGGYFKGSKAVKDDAGSITSTFGGIGPVLTGAFAAIGAGLSVGALVSGLKSAGEEITRMAHDADKLSISTEQLSHLQYAAKQTGIESETLSHAMLKLQETVGKAATEGGEGAKKISDLGLNLKTLVNENPADQFKSIADKIASIQNPAQRAAAEVALFGKSGAELKPLLEQGAAGLDRMAQEADKLGITMSGVDAQNTLRAGQAVQKVQDTVTGLAQHIAAGLAPVVEDVAGKIISWAETGNRMGKIVNGALQGVAYGAAFVADGFKLGKAEIELMGGEGALAIGLLLKEVDVLADSAAWLSEKVFGHHIDTSGIDNATTHMLDKAKELGKAAGSDVADVFSGRTGAKVFEYFDTIGAKANETSKAALKAKEGMGAAFQLDDVEANGKKITDTIAELNKQVAEFGLSEGAKKLADMKLLGASDAQVATAKALADQLDRLKAQADAAKVVEELHKQVDQFGQSDGAKKLADMKLLGGTAEQQSEAKALADQLDVMKQQADVAKELDKLRKDARQAGMDEAGKKVDDLKSMGASAAQLSEATELQKQIEATNAAKEEAKKMDEEAKKAKEDALTPMQKEQEELLKLQKLYESGKISASEYASAAAKKDAELHGESHKVQGAVSRGSQEAFNLMNQINNRASGRDKKEQIAQAQLNAQLKENQILQSLDKKLSPKPQMYVKLAVA